MNNLKQLALAVHAYHDVWARFPMGEMPGSLSPNVAILPYLEQSGLYASFNFNIVPATGLGVGGKVPIWLSPESSTAVSTKIAVLVCPTDYINDSGPPAPDSRPSNYAWNSGTWWPRSRSWDGLFGRSIREGVPNPTAPDPPLGAASFSACQDGLSTTLLLSEVVCGPRELSAQRTRVSDCYEVVGISDVTTPAEAIAVCNAIDWRSSPLPWDGAWRYKGYPWAEGSLWRDWFNTIRTPNQSCCVQSSGKVVPAGWWFMLKPASSYHGSIVQAAMADASVRPFKELISPTIWMDLSTRSGGEVVNSEW
jgi:hypothetical protein